MSADALSATGIRVAVLSAGKARRFGSCKALAPLDGKPLLGHVLGHLWAALPATVATPIVVITGAYRDEVEGYVATLQETCPAAITCHYNPDYQEGVAASLRVATRIAAAQPLLVTFADLPFVSAMDYRNLMAGYQTQERTTFAEFATPRGLTYGPPAIFAPKDLHLLLELQGDRGAKAVFAGDKVINRIHLPNAARDIDRPDQLL